MDSKWFRGEWIAQFEPVDKKRSRFMATESIDYKNPFMRAIGYVFMDLEKFMETYQNDLRNKLVETGKQ